MVPYGQIMLQMACTDVALKHYIRNMLAAPIIWLDTPKKTKMRIQGPKAPVYGHPRSFRSA